MQFRNFQAHTQPENGLLTCKQIHIRSCAPISFKNSVRISLLCLYFFSFLDFFPLSFNTRNSCGKSLLVVVNGEHFFTKRNSKVINPSGMDRELFLVFDSISRVSVVHRATFISRSTLDVLLFFKI